MQRNVMKTPTYLCDGIRNWTTYMKKSVWWYSGPGKVYSVDKLTTSYCPFEPISVGFHIEWVNFEIEGMNFTFLELIYNQ